MTFLFMFGPATVLFLSIYGLKYYWFATQSQLTLCFILDLFHLTIGGFAIGIIWALSQKNKRFHTGLAMALVFLVLWFWYIHWVKGHPGQQNANFIFLINLLTGPLWSIGLRYIPKNLAWAVLPLVGMVYWVWLAGVFRICLFERWKSAPVDPGTGATFLPEKRIVFYWVALVMFVFVFAGMLVLHIQFWRIPGVPKIPFEVLEAASMVLFFLFWVPGFIKQEKDKGIWKRIRLKNEGFLDMPTKVLTAYCIAAFAIVFFGSFLLTLTGMWDKVVPTSPKGHGGWTPESFQGRVFMLGWTAGLVLGAFSSARETFFQIRYLQGRHFENQGIPDEGLTAHQESPDWVLPPEDPKGIEPSLVEHGVMERRGDIEVRVLPSLRRRAPGVLLVAVLFSFFPSIPILIIGQDQTGHLDLVFYVIAALAVLTIMATILPTVYYIYCGRPVAILSAQGLWMIESGWIRWDEIESLRVTKVGDERTIGIVPKDWGWIHRVPWHFRFKALWNRAFFGYLTSYPFKDLTVTGDDFIKVANEKYKVPITWNAKTPFEDFLKGHRRS